MAENLKKRKPNFTAAECAVIIEEVEKSIEIIRCKLSNTATNIKKQKVCQEITQKVNAVGVCLRSTTDIKEKWRGLVSSAKKEQSSFLFNAKKTGGGKRPASPKPATRKKLGAVWRHAKFFRNTRRL